MIVIDTKLSEFTALTNGQNAAKNYAGKGSLAYKSNNIIANDASGVRLPLSINQGNQIPILSFYKLFGDGNSKYMNIKKLK